jgi:hypothetical protein
MKPRSSMYKLFRDARVAGSLLAMALCFSPLATSQDRDRNRDQDRNGYNDRLTRLEPGTVIPVRTNEAIDVDRSDNRVYRAIVDQDVRGNTGRVAIPRGANVELIVRIERDNDLIIDLESVVVNGQRYAVKADANRVGSQRDDSLIGGIIGAISGGEARGRAVRIPRDSVVTFRLQRSLELGVADRGVTRDGVHYHDYYERHDHNQ